MKTIFHTNIDGREIVLGFGEANGLIDPVATAIKIAPLVEAADETKQLTALNAQISSRMQAQGQAFELAVRAKSVGDSATLTRQNAEYLAKGMEIEELQKQLPALITAFEVVRAKLTESNAAYTHPPQGEDLIDDVQAVEMAAKHAARGEGRQLLMTGAYIADLRGRDFYLGPPWQHMVIDKLGEELPSDALTPDILTDVQRAEISGEAEASRVASLTPEERATEVQRVTAAALAQAAQKRSELEISGAKDALAQSQAQYAEAVEAIAEKYGT